MPHFEEPAFELLWVKPNGQFFTKGGGIVRENGNILVWRATASRGIRC